MISYDAFLSYANRPDYSRARRIEVFLESFHKTPTPPGAPLRKIEVCRDGSDFRLPAIRSPEAPDDEDPIWAIILDQLSKSRDLIVLCSPESARSPWVAKEIEWFLRERQNGRLLLVVTRGRNPVLDPEECFPPPVLREKIHTRQIWYDLRGLGSSNLPAEVRDPEDELVRLSTDLLDWDAKRYGPLAALWQREQLKRRRRQASAAVVAGLVLTVAALFAWWQAVRARQATQRARSNIIVLAADAAPNPLNGVLLLGELVDEEEPEGGMRVAQKLATTPIPQAVLRGSGGLSNLAFHPDGTRIFTAAKAGAALWPANGRGNPLVLGAGGDAPLNLAAISPDGTLVALASARGTVRIRSLPGPGRERRLECGGAVEDLAFSADGGFLATVSDHGEARLWSLADGKNSPLRLPGGRKALAVRWSRSGTNGWVAAVNASLWAFTLRGAQDVTIRSSAPRPAEMDALLGPESPFSRSNLLFSPDRSKLAVFFQGQALVESVDGSTKPVFLPHGDLIASVDFNLDGTQLLTAGTDGLARLWSTSDARLLRTFDAGIFKSMIDISLRPAKITEERASLSTALFSPDGSLVATLSTDGVVRIWEAGGPDSPWEPARWLGAHVPGGGDLEKGRWLRFALHGPAASLAAFNRDGSLLATADDEGVVQVWRLTPPDEPQVLSHGSVVKSVSFSPDGKRLVTGARDGIARIWTLGKPQPQELDAHAGEVRSARFSRDGTLVETVHDSSLIRIWRLASSPPILIRDFREHRGSVREARFSPDGQSVLSWSEDRTVRLWRIDGKETTAVFTVGKTPGQKTAPQPYDAELSPDGSLVAVGYDDGWARVWRTSSPGAPLAILPSPGNVWKTVFSPDGSRLLTISDKAPASLWRVARWDQPVRLAPVPAADGLLDGVFSPDGKHVVTGSFDGRVWIWRSDGEGGPVMLVQAGDLAHSGPVALVSFSPAGDLVLSAGGADAEVHVWRPDGTGRPVVIENGAAVTQAEFSPDGRLVASASEIGAVRVSRVRWRDLVRHLRARTSANLTPEQRILYLGETASAAHRTYETLERRYGRTP